MTGRGDPARASAGPRRYGRDTPEFARVANLSDAVFAIAMTLLVLTLDVPSVPSDRLAAELMARAPQMIAFVLSFALVANVWWAHHKFLGLLAYVEPVVIAVNLGILGVVALVPYPTSLIGSNPGAGAAVLPFITLFVLLHLLFLALLLRVQATLAWRFPLPPRLYPWLVLGWLAHLALMAVALLVALWWPVGGLVVAALSGTIVGVTMGVLAPAAYAEWA
jgi:uncharacterized membrane protein